MPVLESWVEGGEGWLGQLHGAGLTGAPWPPVLASRRRKSRPHPPAEPAVTGAVAIRLAASGVSLRYSYDLTTGGAAQSQL